MVTVIIGNAGTSAQVDAIDVVVAIGERMQVGIVIQALKAVQVVVVGMYDLQHLAAKDQVGDTVLAGVVDDSGYLTGHLKHEVSIISPDAVPVAAVEVGELRVIGHVEVANHAIAQVKPFQSGVCCDIQCSQVGVLPNLECVKMLLGIIGECFQSRVGNPCAHKVLVSGQVHTCGTQCDTQCTVIIGVQVMQVVILGQVQLAEYLVVVHPNQMQRVGIYCGVAELTV